MEQQSFAAGMVEGAMTWPQIFDFYQNQYFEWHFPATGVPAKLLTFMKANLAFARQEAATATSDYWQNVKLVLAQFDGLVYGYNKFAATSLTEMQLYFLNAAGDLEDLIGALSSVQTLKMKLALEAPLTDCSALVKATANNLYAGHTTWRNYGIINKMYKRYSFGHYSLSFASSPGFLSSKDDFYITSRALVVMETTNSIFNHSLYANYLTPNSVLTWVRSIVANRMSHNGEQWVNTFKRYNSGSYNNQWIIVDYKLYTPGRPIINNTLWILEQIPGFTQSQDVSSILQAQSFWSSYNIPYNTFIYNISGYPQQKQKISDPDDLDYYNCPRSRIFKREQAKIAEYTDFQHTMQYNEYQTDPFSKGDPSKSISSRYDLRTSGTIAPFGGIDSKCTESSSVFALDAVGICGPTHQDQIPFDWTTWKGTSVSHAGQPNRFDFPWIPLKRNY